MKSPHFRFELKTISRAKGQCAVRQAAYIAGIRIRDVRTGKIFDFTARKNVWLVLPPIGPAGVTWIGDGAAFWNSCEMREKHPRARVAREIIVSLPVQLPRAEACWVTLAFAKAICAGWGLAIQIAYHEKGDGDDRNFHAHLLLSTRVVTTEGWGPKVREWDRADLSAPVVEMLRTMWARVINAAFRREKLDLSVDNRSYLRQGIDRIPGKHRGPYAPKALASSADHAESIAEEIDSGRLELICSDLIRANDRAKRPENSKYRSLFNHDHVGTWTLFLPFRQALQKRLDQIQKAAAKTSDELMVECAAHTLLHWNEHYEAVALKRGNRREQNQGPRESLPSERSL